MRARRITAWACVVALQGLTCALASADPHPAAPSRPTFSDPASAFEPGSLQLEAGYRFDVQDSEVVRHSVPLMLRFQAHELLEVRVGIDTVVVQNDETGVGDLIAGVRGTFVAEDDWVPAIGALFSATANTATRGLGQEGSRLDGRLLVSKGIAGILSVDLNIGVAGHVGGALDGSIDLPASIAATIPLFGLMSVYGELYGIFDLDEPSNEAWVSSILGVSFTALPELVIDAAVELGISDVAPDVGVMLGITWNIADFY